MKYFLIDEDQLRALNGVRTRLHSEMRMDGDAMRNAGHILDSVTRTCKELPVPDDAPAPIPEGKELSATEGDITTPLANRPGAISYEKLESIVQAVLEAPKEISPQERKDLLLTVLALGGLVANHLEGPAPKDAVRRAMRALSVLDPEGFEKAGKNHEAHATSLYQIHQQELVQGLQS